MYDRPDPPLANSAGPRDEMMARQRNATAGPMRTSSRPSIPALLDEQGAALVGLHKTISELENRLAQVLAHDMPTPADSNRIDPPPPVQIADRLTMNNHGISIAQLRLGQLMQRLHL